jgi:hypothetical protein
MRVSEDVVSGMTEAEAAETMRAERPMIVYIYDGEAEEDLRFEIEECKAFFDDKVAIGARFFDCIRIDAESAREDRALAESYKKLPALVFLRPNYEVAARVSGKFTTGKVFSSMCKTMKKDYANCVNTVVKKQQRIMKERVELTKQWGKVDELDERIADEKSDKRRAKLIKEREDLAGKLDKEMGELTATESKLYELESKAAKSA